MFRAVSTGECNNRPLTGFDLLDVIEVLRKDGIIGRNKNRWQIGTYQRDDAVFELGARMTFSKEIRDLFHFERAFECDGKVELATEEKHPANIGIFLRDSFNLITQF